MTQAKATGLFKKIGWWRILEFGLWVVLGLVAAIILSLSLDPWVAWAATFMGSVNDLIFVRMLTWLPIVGGLIKALLGDPVVFVGGAFFVFFNVCQVTFLLMHSHAIKLSPSMREKVNILSVSGTVAEALVATAQHPPYQGGISALLWDAARLRIDWFAFDGNAILIICALLFAFEVFVALGVILILSIRHAHRQKAA
jgi:hypothetical protein